MHPRRPLDCHVVLSNISVNSQIVYDLPLFFLMFLKCMHIKRCSIFGFHNKPIFPMGRRSTIGWISSDLMQLPWLPLSIRHKTTIIADGLESVPHLPHLPHNVIGSSKWMSQSREVMTPAPGTRCFRSCLWVTAFFNPSGMDVSSRIARSDNGWGGEENSFHPPSSSQSSHEHEKEMLEKKKRGAGFIMLYSTF